MSDSDRSTYWQGVLDAQRSSGVPIMRWCDSNDVNMHTFRHWRTKLSKSASAGPAKAADWAEISGPVKPIIGLRKGGTAAPLSAPNHPSAAGHIFESSSHIFVHLGRCSVEVTPGFDPAVLSDVLTVLEARC